MPRTPRLDPPGARQHVMNRSARREDLFTTDATAELFLTFLAQVPERFEARVHGYAVMPNHYHLLLETPRGNLSEVMRYLGSTFTQAYNRRAGHDGPLFRGRFRNRVVESDAYWRHLLAYVHLNPVRAHLVGDPANWVHSSHAAYVGQVSTPDWLTTDELLAGFGGRAALAAYVDDVQRKRRPAPAGFDPERLWSGPMTDEEPTPRPERRRTPDEALAEVAAVLDVPVERLRTRPRGRSPNLTGWLAAWWLGQATALSQAAIGRLLGVSRTRVSQVEDQLRKLAREDEAARAAIQALRARRG